MKHQTNKMLACIPVTTKAFKNGNDGQENILFSEQEGYQVYHPNIYLTCIYQTSYFTRFPLDLFGKQWPHCGHAAITGTSSNPQKTNSNEKTFIPSIFLSGEAKQFFYFFSLPTFIGGKKTTFNYAVWHIKKMPLKKNTGSSHHRRSKKIASEFRGIRTWKGWTLANLSTSLRVTRGQESSCLGWRSKESHSIPQVSHKNPTKCRYLEHGWYWNVRSSTCFDQKMLRLMHKT